MRNYLTVTLRFLLFAYLLGNLAERKIMKTTKEILDALLSGVITKEEAEKILSAERLTHLGEFAVIDQSRGERSGVPEVIFAESKDAQTISQIANSMASTNGFALISRADENKVQVIEKNKGEHLIEVMGNSGMYTVLLYEKDWNPPTTTGKIAIITAGTSDIPYAKEVEAIAKVMGVDALNFHDIGVAGIHRLVEPLRKISSLDIDAIVVLAGMEGALPTVIASLVDIPVIGLPVPIGYGFRGKGEAALAAMLQSCAPGLAVVNIGNGIGAGSIACLIAKRAKK